MADEQGHQHVAAELREQADDGAMTYELTADGQRLTELHVQGAPRHSANFTSGGDLYLLQPLFEAVTRIDIRKEGAGENYAVYHALTDGSGTLELHAGGTYSWQHDGDRWTISNEAGKRLIHITSESGSQPAAHIHLTDDASSLGEVERDLLLATGWYVMLLGSMQR